MRRVEQLNQAVDRLRSECKRWEGDKAASDDLPKYVCEEIERCHRVFHAGPCPTSHIDLSNAVTQLEDAYSGWNDLEDRWTGQDNKPSSAFFTRLRAVFEQRDRLNMELPGALKSVAQCVADGATKDQIARHIYGFRTSDGKTYDSEGSTYAGPLLKNGQIDNTAFESELRQQYSAVPKDWINPRLRADLEKVGYFDEIPAVITEPVERSRPEREGQALKLLREGGTLPQILTVTGLTQDEVAQLADQHELTMPALDDTPKGTTEEMEAAVIELLATGAKPHVIVNTLRPRFPQLNVGVVNALKSKVTPAAAGK